VQSEWVLESPERLGAILLQGLMGPITVNGKNYTPAAAMPGLKLVPEISDGDLADVATFVRHAWNNRKGAVKGEVIEAVRKKLDGRETSFTLEELLKAFQ
jgi:mono/diheme cytochrome c family protein